MNRPFVPTSEPPPCAHALDRERLTTSSSVDCGQGKHSFMCQLWKQVKTAIVTLAIVASGVAIHHGSQATVLPMEKRVQRLETTLGKVWQHWKTNIRQDGFVMSRQNGGATSEGQSYGMLMALYMNDQAAFDQLWSAAKKMQFKANPQVMQSFQQGTQHLFYWRYAMNPQMGREMPVTHEVASDGDLVIAYALQMGAKQWDRADYLQEAKAIISELWTHTVREKNGKLYFSCASHMTPQTSGALVVNSTYLAPDMFRTFSLVDTEHAAGWLKLAEDTYTALEECGRYTAYGIPPSWCDVTWNEGSMVPQKAMDHPQAGYNIESPRIFWHLGQAMINSGDKKAFSWWGHRRFMETVLRRDKGRMYMAYKPDGNPIDDPYYINCQTYGAMVLERALFMDAHNSLGLYEEFLHDRLQKGYCNVPDEYYTTSVTWFSLYQTLQAVKPGMQEKIKLARGW